MTWKYCDCRQKFNLSFNLGKDEKKRWDTKQKWNEKSKSLKNDLSQMNTKKKERRENSGNAETNFLLIFSFNSNQAVQWKPHREKTIRKMKWAAYANDWDEQKFAFCSKNEKKENFTERLTIKNCKMWQMIHWKKTVNLFQMKTYKWMELNGSVWWEPRRLKKNAFMWFLCVTSNLIFY